MHLVFFHKSKRQQEVIACSQQLHFDPRVLRPGLSYQVIKVGSTSVACPQELRTILTRALVTLAAFILKKFARRLQCNMWGLKMMVF